MSPAHVLEPTYDALRRRLFAGDWPSGQRLEAARLAEELGVSMTPVRDSLNRLAGERLVHSSPSEGFQVPLLGETELRGLLDWHEALVGIALARCRAAVMPADLPEEAIQQRRRRSIEPHGHVEIAGRSGRIREAVSPMAKRLATPTMPPFGRALALLERGRWFSCYG